MWFGLLRLCRFHSSTPPVQKSSAGNPYLFSSISFVHCFPSTVNNTSVIHNPTDNCKLERSPPPKAFWDCTCGTNMRQTDLINNRPFSVKSFVAWAQAEIGKLALMSRCKVSKATGIIVTFSVCNSWLYLDLQTTAMTNKHLISNRQRSQTDQLWLIFRLWLSLPRRFWPRFATRSIRDLHGPSDNVVHHC